MLGLGLSPQRLLYCRLNGRHSECPLVRLHQQQPPLGAGFKIHPTWLVVTLLVRASGREAIVQQHDQRKTLLPDCACNEPLTLADGCGVGDSTITRCCQHLFQAALHLIFTGTTRYLHKLPVGPIQQEMVAQRRELQCLNLSLPMQAEEVWV